MPNLVPPPTAASAVYVSTNAYHVVGFTRPSPPVTAAKRCGVTAQRWCSTQSAEDYRACGQVDCENLFCGSPSTSALCNSCLQQRTTCQEGVLARYADCGICPEGTTCKTDLGTTGSYSGYSYCCPPELSPCDGSCTPTACGIGYFDTRTCECDCPPGSECPADDGRIRNCCDRGQTCSHGHCCQIGQTWIDNRCCGNERVCEGICCDGDRHCDKDHCCPVGQRWADEHCCDESKTCSQPLDWSNGAVTYSLDHCCSDMEVCVPDPRFAGYGHCCQAGKTWCQGSSLGQCCLLAKCCDGHCCTATEHCSRNHCCPPGTEWVSSDWTGDPGTEGSCCAYTGNPRKWCGSPAQGFQCCDQDRCCKAPDGSEQCCPVGQYCSNGHCCPTGQEWCDTRCCDTRSDPACCGGCGHTCPQGLSCCPPGQCFDLANDIHHCGDCDSDCWYTNWDSVTREIFAAAWGTCVAGRCHCPPGWNLVGTRPSGNQRCCSPSVPLLCPDNICKPSC